MAIERPMGRVRSFERLGDDLNVLDEEIAHGVIDVRAVKQLLIVSQMIGSSRKG